MLLGQVAMTSDQLRISPAVAQHLEATIPLHGTFLTPTPPSLHPNRALTERFIYGVMASQLMMEHCSVMTIQQMHAHWR